MNAASDYKRILTERPPEATRLTTNKRPGDLILTSAGMVQVQADGSVRPWVRP